MPQHSAPATRARLMLYAALAGLLLVALVLQLSGFAPVPVATPANAAGEEAGLELITATYTVLQDRFFRPLDSRELLGAAWLAARRSLSDQRRLRTDVPAPVFAGDREGDLAEFSTRYREMLAGAGSDVDGVRIAMIASSAMADSVGEQHTTFLTPDALVALRAQLTSDRGQPGLGILISGATAPFTIANVVTGAPADRAGVREGDQIQSVNGRSTANLDLRQLSELLRGGEGEPVTLTVRRGDSSLDVTVVRGRFVASPLQARVLPEGVCHLRLSSFPVAYVEFSSGRNIAQELDAALERCEQGGARGWIMDLRGNGGGGSIMQVLGRFMDNGPISVERAKIGGRYESATDGHLFRVQRPLVVIIDGSSASASEIFASAVQEYKRGVVIGRRTAGALNTATVVPVPLDSAVYVAIRQVFTGRQEVVVDEVGVSPDVDLDVSGDPSIVPPQAISLALNPPAGVGPLPPPPADPPGAMLSTDELRGRLAPLLLRAEDADRAENQIIPGELMLDTLNFYADGTPSLDAERQRALRLGWQGGMVRWLGRGFPPPYAAQVQVYRDADGAHRDFIEEYLPHEPRNPPEYRDVETPIQLGEETRAVIGFGTNEGRVWILWRRGATILLVAENLLPGAPPRFDNVVRLSQIVDARAAQAGL